MDQSSADQLLQNLKEIEEMDYDLRLAPNHQQQTYDSAIQIIDTSVNQMVDKSVNRMPDSKAKQQYDLSDDDEFYNKIQRQMEKEEEFLSKFTKKDKNDVSSFNIQMSLTNNDNTENSNVKKISRVNKSSIQKKTNTNTNMEITNSNMSSTVNKSGVNKINKKSSKVNNSYSNKTVNNTIASQKQKSVVNQQKNVAKKKDENSMVFKQSQQTKVEEQLSQIIKQNQESQNNSFEIDLLQNTKNKQSDMNQKQQDSLVFQNQNGDVGLVQNSKSQQHNNKINNDSNNYVSQQHSKNNYMNEQYDKDQKEKEGQKKSRNLFPQIIDQDTEIFRNRLENILNIFKTETVQEFMVMKKELVENQNEEIKRQTNQYLKQVQELTKKLEGVSEELIMSVGENQRNQKQMSKLIDRLQERNRRIMNQRLIKKYFIDGLLKYRKNKVRRRYLGRIGDKNWNRRLMSKYLGKWIRWAYDSKRENVKQVIQNQAQKDIDSINFKYNKQITNLSDQLAHQNRQLQGQEQMKQQIQDNLKKAFMRGVSQLNFEAMSILHPNTIDQYSNQQIDQQINSNVNSNSNNIMNSNINGNSNSNNVIDSNSNVQQMNDDRCRVTFYDQNKMEGKNHKWKNSGIVGFKQEEEQQQEGKILKFNID